MPPVCGLAFTNWPFLVLGSTGVLQSPTWILKLLQRYFLANGCQIVVAMEGYEQWTFHPFILSSGPVLFFFDVVIFINSDLRVLIYISMSIFKNILYIYLTCRESTNREHQAE